MFNDRLNVRTGNQRRKAAAARIATKMLQAASRGSAFGQTGQAPGGLGRQNAARFRPHFAGRNMGMDARLMEGGSPEMANAIGLYGVVDRQPGANDPALGSPGSPVGGSVPGQSQGASPAEGGVPSPTGGPAGASGGSAGTSGGNRGLNMGIDGDLVNPIQPSAPQPEGIPAGFAMYQGQLIPIGVLRAMQQTGELI